MIALALVAVSSQFYLGILVTLATLIAVVAGIAFVVKFIIEASPALLFFICLMALSTLLLVCGALGILTFPPLGTS